MKWFFLLVLVLPVSASDVISFSRAASTFFLILNDSKIDLTFGSSTAVHVRWHQSDSLTDLPLQPADHPNVTMKESDHEIQFVTRELLVRINKQPFRISFATPDGAPVLFDGERQFLNNRHNWSFKIQNAAAIYGLGVQKSDRLNRYGQKFSSAIPFFFTNENYGMYFPQGQHAEFDFGNAHENQVSILLQPNVSPEFSFYLGMPKGVLEQHHQMWPATFNYQRNDVAIQTENTIPRYSTTFKGTTKEILGQVIQTSLSGGVIPSVVAQGKSEYRNDLFLALFPILGTAQNYSLKPEAQDLHSKLEYHFITYIQEALDRGFSVIHSLPFQFPSSPDVAEISDQFMLGDELLVAPILDEKDQRSVYFPQGIWTDLHTNRMFRGRRTETISSPKNEIPLFVRNGSILPLKRGDLIDLHYFPKLGAEYFIYEPELREISQIHAGPAVDILRLEIETAVDRTYEWVVHNIAEPSLIETRTIRYTKSESQMKLRPGEWYYDSSLKNLHVRAEAHPHTSLILNVSFEKEGWFIQ